MSEIPRPLRDAIAHHMIPEVPLSQRRVGWFSDATGRLAWSRTSTEHYALPAVAESLVESERSLEIAAHRTPAGFSPRVCTRILRPASSAPEGSIWESSRAILADWRRGALTLDPSARHAIDPDMVGGEEPRFGARAFPLRSPTLPPATHTNLVFAGRGPDALLVDPGATDLAEQARLSVAYDRFVGRFGPARAIFLTHHHADHVSGAAALRAQTGLPIWAHAETAERVAFGVDRCLKGGARLGEFEVLLTPGHAPGHLCLLHQQTRALIAGDMVASLGTVVIDPDGGDMQQYVDSLRQLIARRPAGIYPAHGAYISDAVGRLEATLAHRLWRESQLLAALTERSCVGLAQLTRLAYAEVRASILWLAERQALAHLLKLEREGRVARDADGRWLLSPAA